MGNFALRKFLFATLLCYSFIIAASGMSHPPLIVAPDPNANSVFLKKAELEPAATGTHASQGKHANHGDGKNYNSGKIAGEGYHKTSGFEENLGYQKKDKGNYGVQGTSGFSKSDGNSYGGGHHKANAGKGFEALGGKSHGGAAGDSFHDIHQDNNKKFKEFVASLQADNSFKAFSHGDQKSYGDGYDNVEGFHKGDKGGFSESDGYEVKEGHDNSGGKKYNKKGEYNDEYDHKEGNFGNAKYGEHKHKSGQQEGQKSVQGEKGGSSDKYNKKHGHGNLRGHNDHSSHHDHHSSGHKEGRDSSQNIGNSHHGNSNDGKHHGGGHHGGGQHGGVHHAGKHGGHQHAANLAGHHTSGYQAGSLAHHGGQHNGGHQASNVAQHIPIIPVYYPHLTPPGTTAAPHLQIAAINSGKASEHKPLVPNKGHVQTLATIGNAASHLGFPASSIIVHEGGIIQHGTHLGLPLIPLAETAQDSQIQPILAAVDDNIVSSSAAHASYEDGTEEVSPKPVYESKNEGQEYNNQNDKNKNNKNPSFSSDIKRAYNNGEERTESSHARQEISGDNGRVVYEKQGSRPANKHVPTLTISHRSNPDYKGIEISHLEEGPDIPEEESISYESNMQGKGSIHQDGRKDVRNREGKVESGRKIIHSSEPKNTAIYQEYETEKSSKISENDQKDFDTNEGHDSVIEEATAHGSSLNLDLKIKDAHSTNGRAGTLHRYKDRENSKGNERNGPQSKVVQVILKQGSSEKSNEGLKRSTEINSEYNEEQTMKAYASDGNGHSLNDAVDGQGESQGNKNSDEPQQEQIDSKPENFEPTISEVIVATKNVISDGGKSSSVDYQKETPSNQNENSNNEGSIYGQLEQEAKEEEASETSKSMF